MELRLDRESPTPLYRQIVQTIRWRIGTGALRAGDRLPVMRQAADEWRVNYHTVRRAYHELAAAGLIETVQGSGTVVAAAPRPGPEVAETDVEGWLDSVVSAGRARYGLSVDALSARILERRRAQRVVMIECNAHQAGFLARQLEDAWPVEAIAWSLDEPGDPPPLPLIGTYFHHAEMRERWPHRLDSMWFVALWLDRALEERVAKASARHPVRTLRLVEQDPGTAEEMAAGVSALLSPRFDVTTSVGDPIDYFRTLGADELLLVAPRLWDRLPVSMQQDERVLDVRHVIIPDELQRVWRLLTLANAVSHAS